MVVRHAAGHAGLPAFGPHRLRHRAATATLRHGAPLRESRAYIANTGANTVTPVTTATNTAGPPITVGRFPDPIAITPNGKTAYIANGDGTGTVTPITTATNTAHLPITVGNGPSAIAITPNGKTAHVRGPA